MAITFKRPLTAVAAGALAMGMLAIAPAGEAQAAQRSGSPAATNSQAPIEMQHRGGGRGQLGMGRGFAGGGYRGGGWGGGYRGGYRGGWAGGGYRGGYYRRGWYGPGPWAGAAAAGLLLGGAAVAAPYYYERDCWIERRWVERWDGYAVPRDVRVCR